MTITKETYTQYNTRREKEVNEFTSKYCHFAFGKEQWNELLKKLGLTEKQLKEQYASFGYGGIIRKDKIKDFEDMSERHYNELQKLMEDYKFAKTAFKYQLGNYECYISYRLDEALLALGLTEEEVLQNETLKRAFLDARKEYWDWCNENL